VQKILESLIWANVFFGHVQDVSNAVLSRFSFFILADDSGTPKFIDVVEPIILSWSATSDSMFPALALSGCGCLTCVWYAQTVRPCSATLGLFQV
jgi:hypothetical protein